MGRKSLSEELKITRRYSDLTPKAFKLIDKKLKSTDTSEQNFALNWLKGGFEKMIPQTLKGDKDNPLQVIPIYAGLSKHQRNEEDIQPNQKN